MGRGFEPHRGHSSKKRLGTFLTALFIINDFAMTTFIHFLLQHIPRKYLQKFSKAGIWIFSILYTGRTVCCPVCGRRFRKFLSYGYVVARKNALCPHCLALERHRLIWIYLRQETTFFSSPLKVLHVAPEYTFLKRFKKLKNLEYITGDLESPWATVKMDIQNIPLKDNTFDVVICNHVLEHVDDDIQAMRELGRVLKPGGWGIVQSPINLSRKVTFEDKTITSPEEREKYFGQKDHVREYGTDYGERLVSAGLQVEAIDYAAKLSPEEISYYALPQEKIYKITKPVQ